MNLAMETPPHMSESVPSVAPRHGSKLRLSLVVLAVLLCAALLVLFIVPNFSSHDFVWLTPAQAAQATQSGPFEKAKMTLKSWLAPWLHRYYGLRPNIRIEAKLMVILRDGTMPGVLGAPVLTNADGTRSWILLLSELLSLKQNLNTNQRIAVLFAPIIQTGDGMQARMSMGQSIPLGPTNQQPGVVGRKANASWINVGLSVDVLPKSVSGSVRLPLITTSTELAGPAITGGPILKTNFSVACRALIPDAGALVINCRDVGGASPTNYLLIFSPVRVDATGKPLKH